MLKALLIINLADCGHSLKILISLEPTTFFSIWIKTRVLNYFNNALPPACQISAKMEYDQGMPQLKNYRQTNGIPRKSHTTITKQQEGAQSKASSPLPPLPPIPLSLYLSLSLGCFSTHSFSRQIVINLL